MSYYVYYYSSGKNLYYENMYVYSGGVAAKTKIYRNGNLYVSSGGKANNTNIYSGGNLYVSYGGRANNTKIYSGGHLYVMSYNNTKNIIIYNGGAVHFNYGDGFNIYATPGADIYYGSSSKEYHINRGGYFKKVTYSAGRTILSSGAIAKNFTMDRIAYQHISAGGKSINAIISGTYQTISRGGKSLGTKIFSGTQYVYSGGHALNTHIYSSGNMYIYSKGVGTNIHVHSGGRLTVSSGGLLGGINTLNRGTISGSYSYSYSYYSSNNIINLKRNASLNVNNYSYIWGNLNISNASLKFSGVGNYLNALTTNSRSRVVFNLTNITPYNYSPLVSITSASRNVGTYYIYVKRLQRAGTYKLAYNLSVPTYKRFTIKIGSRNLGSAKLGISSLVRNGVRYRVSKSGSYLNLSITNNIGRVYSNSNSVASVSTNRVIGQTGTSGSDIFYGAKRNNIINGINGRDVAVYNNVSWGNDVIKRTNGTMTILFSELSKSDITLKKNVDKMVITRKNDSSQRITIYGWNNSTHNIVYTSSSLNNSNVYLKTAAPSIAQTNAARNEVLKMAKLTTA